MTTPDPSRLLPEVLAAVAATDAIVRDHWDKPRHVRLKGRIDLVTETDVTVERELTARLTRLLPGSTMLAEESAPGAELGAATWIVDPLDGTTNFAHKLPVVATSVGLWDGEGVCLGVVSLPILHETFWAVRGKGAWTAPAPRLAGAERIHVTETGDLEQALVATGFPYGIREECADIVARLARVLPVARGVRRMGSAATDLAYTACGRMDAFYETSLKPWDTAAGWLLVEEAGGRVTRFAPAEPYYPGAPTLLASNGRVHDALEALLEL
jgi:myo-inositol-1(or 4)-monophosphatase